MIEGLKFWLQEIFANRMSSWPVAGILYCLAVFCLRDFFLNPLFLKVRELPKNERRDVKRIYLSRAFAGWGFFGISLLLFIFTWRLPSLYPVTLKIAGMLLAAAFFAGLFITTHLQAVGLALAEMLHKITASPPATNDSL